MAEETWLIHYTNREGLPATSRTFTSREAVLAHARDLLRQFCTVHCIVGPHETIDRTVVEQWAKDNPE
jgi:hypothetical protein